MGRLRRFDRKHRTRPKKRGGERRRRERVQRKRLVALGLSAESVAAMNPKQVREWLKRPLRTRKLAARANKS